MRITRSFILAFAAMAALGLAACGGGGDAKKSTQVAAKVNKDEITVHQVNAALPRLDNPTEAQAKAAGKQVLERLVDQQLFIQKAEEAKLDRDPQVVTAIENAKREILARAYLERVMSSASKANPDTIKDFYAKHPELFSERRVYRLAELAVQVQGEPATKLRDALKDMKTLNDVVAYVKANNLPYKANNSVRAAEQLPMEFVSRIAKMKDGDIVAVPGAGGMAVVQIAASQSQPLDQKQATPFIEQFLQNKTRMELAQSELKSLRGAAKIEYMGEFAKTAADAAGAPALPAPGPASADAPAAAAPVTDPGAPAAAPAGAIAPAASQDFLEKGLSGLKK